MADCRMTLGHPKSLPAMMASVVLKLKLPDDVAAIHRQILVQSRRDKKYERIELRRRESRHRTKSRLGGNSAGPDQPKLRLRLPELTFSITTMAALPTMRQLGCLRSLIKTTEAVQPQIGGRFISTAYSQRPQRVPLPPNLPEQFLSQIPVRHQPGNDGMCLAPIENVACVLY